MPTLKTSYPIEYQCWNNMKGRCADTTGRMYKYYGARGIKVCNRWRASFAKFLEDMGPKPEKHFSLDRINNDGQYKPSNCRWAPPDIQQQNRRDRVIIPMVKQHPIVTDLIADIEAYCARAGITRTDFGKYALNNGNFVTRLKRGQSPSLRTIDRVRRYIDSRTKAVGKDWNARA